MHHANLKLLINKYLFTFKFIFKRLIDKIFINLNKNNYIYLKMNSKYIIIKLNKLSRSKFILITFIFKFNSFYLINFPIN